MEKNASTGYFLELIYNASFIPLHYYVKDVPAAAFPAEEISDELIRRYIPLLTGRSENVYYISTKEFLYIGIVQNFKTEESVIVGPVGNLPFTSGFADSLINDYGLPDERKAQIEEFYLRTPKFTVGQFFNILALINKELNNEMIDVIKTFNVFDASAAEQIAKSHSDKLYERKENEIYHNTYLFEKEYYDYVKRGDTEGLRSFIKSIPSLTEGKIADDSLRQAKNIFIASMTLATRQAVAGGLDVETAYQLSDSYIREVEKMTNSTAINLLNATAVIDFTKRVSEAKIPMGMSSDVYKAIQYISNRVNQSVSVEDTAKYLNLERSTLSKKFKRELGFNISAYITRRKLEEAKSLLRYSERGISEISEYLCFSSQSYFQNVFKKKYGITPKAYRISNKFS